MQLKGSLTKETLKDLDKVRLSATNHKIPRVWVMTADKDAARVFRRDGKHLALLGEIAPKKDVSGIEDFEEKTIHHHYSPDNKPNQRRGEEFLLHLAKWLNNAVQQDAFDRLVIAAAPPNLGILRKSLNKQTQERVITEINKDLMKHGKADLEKDLADVVWL